VPAGERSRQPDTACARVSAAGHAAVPFQHLEKGCQSQGGSGCSPPRPASRLRRQGRRCWNPRRKRGVAREIGPCSCRSRRLACRHGPGVSARVRSRVLLFSLSVTNDLLPAPGAHDDDNDGVLPARPAWSPARTTALLPCRPRTASRAGPSPPAQRRQTPAPRRRTGSAFQLGASAEAASPLPSLPAVGHLRRRASATLVRLPPQPSSRAPNGCGLSACWASNFSPRRSIWGWGSAESQAEGTSIQRRTDAALALAVSTSSTPAASTSTTTIRLAASTARPSRRPQLRSAIREPVCPPWTGSPTTPLTLPP